MTAPARRSPARDALRRFRRDRLAMAGAVGLLLIVLACLAAPVYAGAIAHTDPFTSDVGGTVTLGGRVVPVMQPDANPLPLGV